MIAIVVTCASFPFGEDGEVEGGSNRWLDNRQSAARQKKKKKKKKKNKKKKKKKKKNRKIEK